MPWLGQHSISFELKNQTLQVMIEACPAGFQRPNGTDLARMKSLLFTAKSKAVPVSARI